MSVWQGAVDCDGPGGIAAPMSDSQRLLVIAEERGGEIVCNATDHLTRSGRKRHSANRIRA